MSEPTPTKQEQFWSSDEGGGAYTQRNRVDWRKRVPFWEDVLKRTMPRSVLEVGANAGWNLSAMGECYPLAGPLPPKLVGVEINQAALEEAQRAGLDVRHASARALPFRDGEFDLTFTAGMLIHVAPEDLPTVMGEIVRASAHWILAVEYHDVVEVEVNYRGQDGLLWRRPFSKLYQERGLRLVDEWDAGAGFDRCRAYLLTKESA
mgnify:CR=1 FL=1